MKSNILEVLEIEEKEENDLLHKISPKNIKELEDFVNNYLDGPLLDIKPTYRNLKEKHISYSIDATIKIDGVCASDFQPIKAFGKFEKTIEFDLENTLNFTNDKKNIPIHNIRISWVPYIDTFRIEKGGILYGLRAE